MTRTRLDIAIVMSHHRPSIFFPYQPTKPFKVHWESCCWVYFTTDDGELIWGDVIRLTATIFNLENNSPIVKIPQIWRIMSGCNDQAVHLSPFDLDGDTVRCRWAEYGESDFASMHDPTNFGSLNLTSDSCILSYGTGFTNSISPSCVISVMDPKRPQ